jgi:hypothetical protein
MSDFAQFLMLLGWVGGLVIAEGWSQVVLAVLIPPYSWYLVIELWFTTMGWVQ